MLTPTRGESAWRSQSRDTTCNRRARYSAGPSPRRVHGPQGCNRSARPASGKYRLVNRGLMRKRTPLEPEGQCGRRDVLVQSCSSAGTLRSTGLYRLFMAILWKSGSSTSQRDSSFHFRIPRCFNKLAAPIGGRSRLLWKSCSFWFRHLSKPPKRRTAAVRGHPP